MKNFKKVVNFIVFFVLKGDKNEDWLNVSRSKRFLLLNLYIGIKIIIVNFGYIIF